MIYSSDVGKNVEYRGTALGVFPRGIEHVNLLLVSLSDDAAFLQSAGGLLFGVLAHDCSNPEPLIHPALPPDFAPTEPAFLDPPLDSQAFDSNAPTPDDMAPAALDSQQTPLSECILALRASTRALLQGELATTHNIQTPEARALLSPLEQDPLDPNHFVVRPMPSEIPDWSVAPLVDRFKSLRSARSGSRRNTL